MTTMTMNAASLRTAPQFRKPSFAEIRAALPDMPAEGSLSARVTGMLVRASAAAVPFAALGWMFIAR